MSNPRKPVPGHSLSTANIPTGLARCLSDSEKPPAFQLKVGDGKLKLVGGPLPDPPLAEDDPPLNEWRRYRLDPDDRGPVEFVGKLVARAAVVRHRNTMRTWLGLHETRAGKGILRMTKVDGSRGGWAWDSGQADESETVRVFDSVDAALDTVRSATLRHQLLTDLGRESVQFIE